MKWQLAGLVCSSRYLPRVSWGSRRRPLPWQAASKSPSSTSERRVGKSATEQHSSSAIRTCLELLRAYGVPENQLITVRGGEDHEFGTFSLKVIPSLHTRWTTNIYFSSATAPAGLKAPLTLEQLHPEGGTQLFLIRVDGHQILLFGGNNYLERELTGIEPDVALIGAGASRKEIYDYRGRLMRALNYPALVLPTHWDNFLAPYEASQQAALDAVQGLVQEIVSVSPKTKVVVPKYFETIPLEVRPP